MSGVAESSSGAGERGWTDHNPLSLPSVWTQEENEYFVNKDTALYRWSSRFHMKGSWHPTVRDVSWSSALGTPPYIEAAMVPTYEAAVAAGDCGCLSAEGFLLFTQIHLAAKEQQEDFWTKLTSMTSVWSRQTKLKAPYHPNVDYWKHPTILEPDGSADHAEAEGQPLINNYGGAMEPEHPWDVTARHNYAPAYYVSRKVFGRYGAFDVEKAMADWTTARPGQASENEVKSVVREYFPAARYAGFHKGFVNEEYWFQFGMNQGAMRRHAHSCLRIEVVVSSPPRSGYQKM
jgi:hypothetical protein